MPNSILEQANAAEIARIKAAAPSQFVVGGTFDGHKVSGGVSFQRTWKNGWGATAYAKAWWQDASVTPIATPQSGVVVGVEGIKKFGSGD